MPPPVPGAAARLRARRADGCATAGSCATGRASAAAPTRARRCRATPSTSGLLGGPLREPGGFRALVGEPDGSDPRRPVKRGLARHPRRLAAGDLHRERRAAAGGRARDEVLRWKLRRLVPFRVDELRVSAAEVPPLPRPGGAAAAAPRLRRRAAPGAGRGRLRRRTASGSARSRTPACRCCSAAGHPRAGELTALAVVDESGYTLVFARGGDAGSPPLQGVHRRLPEATRAAS